MKKLILLIGLVAFLGYGITPVHATVGYSKVVVKDDPPKADKADKKDVKDAKCCKGKDASCCKGKDAKAGCSGKCEHSMKETPSDSKTSQPDDKAPVPQK
ncbi:MAG: hypothetical protein NTW49_04020 [Bacteroidia bacterium]|nr:hypothetical protein [Bacteroidia bacterium]